MNHAGHFTDAGGSTDFSLTYPGEISGRRVYEITNGYLLLPAGCEVSPVLLEIRDPSGNNKFSREYRQVINMAFSPDKNFCVFSDLEKLVRIDFQNMTSTEFPASTVFAINSFGDVVLYDEKDQSIFINEKKFPIGEPLYKISFNKKKILAMARNCIYEISVSNLRRLFCLQEGRLFDWMIRNDEVYFSQKIRTQDEFIFRSYKSTDLVSYTFLEEKRMKRFPENYNPASLKSQNLRSLTPAGDSIKNPIDFFSDTVYQPVGNSYAEIQFYGSPPYLHPGVDLLGNYLQDVRSVKDGFVKSIITTADTFHWRIAVANENTPLESTGYLYAHLDKNTIPFQVGDSVSEGDLVGQLVNFPVPGFIHCHFARIVDTGYVWTGGWWTYQNPLSYMTNFFDTVPPVFEKTINNDAFAFRDVLGNYLSPDSLFGQVRIISKFYDLINSNWHVDVNKIRYNLSPLVQPQTLLLDTFSYEYDFYTDVYPAGNYYPGVLRTIYSRDSICLSSADYSVRDFYHIVSNSDGNDTITPADSSQFFNTHNFSDGQYILRVFATDVKGNTSMDSMVIGIKNYVINVNSLSGSGINIFPNPSVTGSFKIDFGTLVPDKLEVYNSIGEKVLEDVNFPSPVSVLNLPENGLYFIYIYSGGKKLVGKMNVISPR